MASNITLSFWALTFLYDLSMSFTLGDQLFFQFTSQPFPKAQASPRSISNNVDLKNPPIAPINQVNTAGEVFAKTHPKHNVLVIPFPEECGPYQPFTS